MEITCFNCQQTWEVPAGHALTARLKSGLGFQDHAVPCPNCGAKNVIAGEHFPYGRQTGPVPGSEVRTHPQDVTGSLRYEAGEAPTNPIEAPRPSGRGRQAVVLAKSLDLHRDHNIHDEVMGNLKDGEQITIVDTWTNGEEFWVQLGPERWAPVEQDGQPLIDLIEGE